MLDSQLQNQVNREIYTAGTPLTDLNPIQQVAMNMGIEVPRSKDFESTRELAEAIFKKMETGDISRNICVDIANGSIFNLEACAGRSIITLPPLYCLSRSEVPFSGPNDPALENEENVLAFAKEVHSRRTTKEGSEISVTQADRMNLRLYLAATKNSEKTANMVSFILAHELGHVENMHSQKKRAYHKELSSTFYTVVNVLTLGLLKKMALDFQSRQCEREADEFAYKNPDNAKGGIHLFDTISNFSPAGMVEKLAYHIYNFSVLFTHGSFESRSDRIKSYWNIA